MAPRRRAVFPVRAVVVKVFDLATGADRRTVRPAADPATTPGHSRVTGLVVLPGDRYVLTTLNDGTALVWDLDALPRPSAGRPARGRGPAAWWDGFGFGRRYQGLHGRVEAGEAPAGKSSRSSAACGRRLPVDPGEVRRLVAALDDPRSPPASGRAGGWRHGPGHRPPPGGPRTTGPVGRGRRAAVAAGGGAGRPVASGEVRRAVRATAVLEWVGTADARRLMEELAAGTAAAPETGPAARAALQRMRAVVRDRAVSRGPKAKRG